MTQVVVIALVVALVAHDALRAAAQTGQHPAWFDRAAPPGSVWWMLLAYALIALGVQAWTWRCGRRIDRAGSIAALWSARSMVSLSRAAILFVYLTSVFAMGWVSRVREGVGDVVLADEIIVMSPALGALFLGYWSYGGIERRLREAGLFASVERGEVIHPARSPWTYMTDQVRHQVLFMLVPMWMVLGWVEGVGLAASWLSARGVAWINGGAGSWVVGALDAAGALAVFVLAPPIIRRIWRTERLGQGPLRARLEELCARHAVRHRGILLWRTHGTMINGAVMGLLPRLRYILLTDLLLERLEEREVEAVMAHELGHIVRRHVPWLLAGMAAALGVTATLAAWIGGAMASAAGLSDAQREIIDVSAALAGIALGLVLVGRISRMFEREADAFAVQHLAGMRSGGGGQRAMIGEEAADGMQNALRAVARENHIPLWKWTWRHGSLGGRIAAIGQLVGQRVGELPIDRAARRVRWWIVLALAVTLAASLMERLAAG